MKRPIPLFDILENISHYTPIFSEDTWMSDDYHQVIAFLKFFKSDIATLHACHRELERLLLWSWYIAQKSLQHFDKTDIENFISFCEKPPTTWIGTKKVARFITENRQLIPNSDWRPFIAIIKKKSFRRRRRSNVKDFELTIESKNEIYSILHIFYEFLCHEKYVAENPVVVALQKSKIARKKPNETNPRRLPKSQWVYILATAKKMAEEYPDLYEQTLFITTLLYTLNLPLTKLIATQSWIPAMNHFQQDSDGNWWFITTGKANTERRLAVPDVTLLGLKRWREHLGLTLLPTATESTPLLPKAKGSGPGPINSGIVVRGILKNCFDKTIDQLRHDGLHGEAAELLETTTLWLRHINVELQKNHPSSKKKLVEA